MDRNENRALFAQAPVGRAVVSLVAPTVISQLITVIYNMADTFFIGQIGDPNQVAAVSLCMPMFVFLTGLANLFGIGGSISGFNLHSFLVAVVGAILVLGVFRLLRRE